MTKPSIFVRKVVPSDVNYTSEATQVVNAAYSSGAGWTTESDFVTGLRCTEDDMKIFIEENGNPHTLLFAFEGEAIVGTIQIEHSEEHPNDGEIRLFSVSPDHQSRGIGGILFRAVLAEMKSLGYTHAVMRIFENRPELLAWYTKLGFKETGERFGFHAPDRLKDKTIQFMTLKKSI